MARSKKTNYMKKDKLQDNNIDLLVELVQKIEIKKEKTDIEEKLFESVKKKLKLLKSNKMVEK